MMQSCRFAFGRLFGFAQQCFFYLSLYSRLVVECHNCHKTKNSDSFRNTFKRSVFLASFSAVTEQLLCIMQISQALQVSICLLQSSARCELFHLLTNELKAYIHRHVLILKIKKNIFRTVLGLVYFFKIIQYVF